MAIVYPNINGNWSDTAIWYSGGAPYGMVPQAGDEVSANNKTVIVDVNTNNLLMLTSAGLGPAVNGGVFTASIGGVSINSTSIQAGTYRALNVSHLTGVVTVNGDCIGSDISAQYGVYITSSASTIVNGDVIGGSWNGAAWGCYANGLGHVTVTGSCFGGTVNGTCYGLCCGNYSTVDVIGDQYSRLGSVAASIAYYNYTTINIYGDVYSESIPSGGSYVIGQYSTFYGTINIYGDLYRGTDTAPNHLIELGNNQCNLNIIGNVTSSSVTGRHCINASNTAASQFIDITGNVTAGPVSTGYAISMRATELSVTGNITASSLSPAISSSYANAKIIVDGNIVNVDGTMAIYAMTLQIDDANLINWTLQDPNGINRTLSTSASGLPIFADVRNGTLYGESNEFTGTLDVPLASQVLVGVPVDDTVGEFDGSGSDPVDYQAFADIVGESIKANLI